ncbi:transposase [Streptomyces eurythermus]
MNRRMAKGVHHEALRNWIHQAEADAGERGDMPTTAEREELAALRKKNAQLECVNEVLRTASAVLMARLDPPRPRMMALVEEHPHLEPVLRELSIPSSAYDRWRRRGRPRRP